MKVIMIIGASQVGKSTLASRLLAQIPNIPVMTHDMDSVSDLEQFKDLTSYHPLVAGMILVTCETKYVNQELLDQYVSYSILVYDDTKLPIYMPKRVATDYAINNNGTLERFLKLVDAVDWKHIVTKQLRAKE